MTDVLGELELLHKQVSCHWLLLLCVCSVVRCSAVLAAAVWYIVVFTRRRTSFVHDGTAAERYYEAGVPPQEMPPVLA